MARYVGPCLLVLLLGCTRRNPGFDEPNASTGSTSATSTTAAASTGEPATSEPTTSGSSTPGSSDTGGTVGLTDSGTGTTEALSTSGPDPTTGSTGTSTTSATSGSESSSSGEPEPPNPEHLQHYDPARCIQPLWCFKNMNVLDGANARTGSQACFTPETPAPYGLTRVGYRVVARFGDLSGTRLQVHERTDNGPGQLLLDLPLSDPELSIGPHARLIEPPLEISSAGLCVGLLGGSINPGAGLGVAVDTQVLKPKESYVRIEGGPGCNFGWKDVDAFEPPPTPEGAWCIDARVVPL